MAQKKRKSFNIEEKAHIIWRLESGEKNMDIAKECGVSHSTISTIWKDREKIKALFEKNALNIKKMRSSEHRVIEEALLRWFKYQRSFNIPINGPILQQKATELARNMGDENFQCSSSWIQRFRARHNIVFGKICGESAAAPAGVAEEWLLKNWPILRRDYSPENIFNADETGLFFNMTPDKTLKFKGEQCSGGKMSKARLTVLVASNMTGSCKEKLLVIGKSKKPRCFKNVRSLPVSYENNNKAWMTGELFEKWLCKWDEQLKSKKRKILLIVDNCPAHPEIRNLKFIKLVFLPPNVTSVLQPLDQGVIKSLKTQYRKLQVLQMLQNIEKGQPCNFNILDGILMIAEAWEKVTPATIANCFRHAGFDDRPSISDEEDNVPLATLQHKNFESDEDGVSLAVLAQQLSGSSFSKEEIENFIEIDQNVAVCEQITEESILEVVVTNKKQQEGEKTEEEPTEEEEEEEEEELRPPTLCEALSAVTTLQKFLLFHERFDNNVHQRILKEMRSNMQRAYEVNKKQTQITDFFKN